MFAIKLLREELYDMAWFLCDEPRERNAAPGRFGAAAAIIAL
jgi:hypothetical protein